MLIESVALATALLIADSNVPVETTTPLPLVQLISIDSDGVPSGGTIEYNTKPNSAICCGGCNGKCSK